MARLQYQNLSPDQIDWDATHRSQNPNWAQDLTPDQIDWESTEERRHRSVRRPAPEPDFLDTAAIIGWEVMPAIAGSLVLSWLGPKGIALGGAMGSAAGNYMSQRYRINRGFQKDLGYGELAAATAIGAVPLSALPGKGALARTAIRGTEGSALATGELYARTYLDEGRAPTSDEISKTLLFGAAFGGVLGAAEAKWLSMKTGVDDLEGKTRPQALKLLENKIDDVGGPANYEAISPTGFFTFRDPYGNFTFRDPDVFAPTARDTNQLGPRRLQELDQQALPGQRGLPGPRQARLGAPKTGSDVIIEIEAMPVKDYAEGVLSGLENKLLLETDDMVRGLARSDEVAPEFQALKDAFEKEIASSNELFTGINPIVAKGNLADNKRLREIDAELEELGIAEHVGDTYGPEAFTGATTSAKNRKKIAKLEKERDRLHLKHGIIQVRGGAAGLAVGAGMLSQAEEEELRELGPWGIGLGMFAAATTGRKPGLWKRAKNAIFGGKKQADNEVAEAAKANKTPPPVEPPAPPPPAKTGTTQASQARKKQTTPRDKQDIRAWYFDELIEAIDDGTDQVLVEQAVQELARRAARDKGFALRLQRKLDELQQTGKAPKLTKATVTEEGAGRLTPATDPATRQAISEGIEQGTLVQPRGLEGRHFFDMKNDELLIAIQRGDAESEVAAREALRRATEGKPKTRRFFEKHAPMIFPAILASGVSIGAVADILEEEDENGQIRQAGMGGFMLLLLAAGLGQHGYRKFMKTKQGRQAKIAAQLHPNKVEPDAIKAKRVDTATEKAQNLYVPPSELRKTMQGVMDMANHILVPLSRNLKKISPILAGEFRKHDGKIRVKTREYMDRAAPFITNMTKILRPELLKKIAGEKGNPELFQRFKFLLLNGKYLATEKGEDSLAIMLDEMVASRIIGVKEKNKLSKEMIEMRDALDEIRTYAREEGGIDVGYFENYFPRQVNDYASFKKYLDETLDNRDLRNDIEKALDEYAKKYSIPSRDLIPADEAAEVTSRVLRGYPTQPGATLAPNFKKRSLNEVTPEMLDAYADPADALKTYIERAVDSTERRVFLGRKPATASKTVGFEGSRDRVGSDLGMRMDVDESLGAAVANRLAKETGQNLSQEDVIKLASIIQSRFSGKTVDPLIQGIKNASYIQVMGNFGSAITQLAEISYAAFFHGFDNTFHALFNRKDNFNFTKHFGLQDHHIDAQTSAGGLSKLLDQVFTGVGLKKLDQLSKNTIMNASWKKYRAQALREGESGKLMDELSPIFGKERARLMIRDLVSKKPNSKNLTKPVEELIWYKFLDLNPATLTEMPSGYTQSGNARILYMLKTFTIKQFDVYREAAGKDVARATALYKKGNKKAAAKAAGAAVAKFAGLATLFAAANASTDVVKDTLYGRPTKPDELVTNNILRLMGVNRYLAYQAKREGLGKSIFSMALPPTAVIDRAGKDLMDVIGDGEYKGNMLQGTPFDLIYWRYLGGLDKIENAK